MCGLWLRMVALVGLGRPMDAGKPARGDSSGGEFSVSALEKGWLSGNLSIASILFFCSNTSFRVQHEMRSHTLYVQFCRSSYSSFSYILPSKVACVCAMRRRGTFC